VRHGHGVNESEMHILVIEKPDGSIDFADERWPRIEADRSIAAFGSSMTGELVDV
jgi:hypothetical protein